VPKLFDSKGHLRLPSELKDLRFATRRESAAILAVLNSSLFYWYLNVVSDWRNLNRREFELFPSDLSTFNTETMRGLSRLAPRLMTDFEANSKLIEMNYSQHGRMQIQCVYPKYAKPIVDEIDCVLARHYRFTGEELDFIINYDIKYRLGAQPGDED
jgi:hypothetical protein